MYRMVESNRNLAVKNQTLKITPAIAKPQMTPNIDHPQGPRNVVNVNGV